MSKPNFVIVENHTDRIDWEELKKDYVDPNMTIDDICRKHDISRKKYYSFRKQLVEETDIAYKPTTKTHRSLQYGKTKHIYPIKLTGKWRVAKFKDYKTHNFGNYDSFETALEVRNLLIEHNWSHSYYENVIKPKYNPSVDQSLPNGFENDYLSGEMTVGELLEKYNLTMYQYYLISSPIKVKHGLAQKPKKVKV